MLYFIAITVSAQDIIYDFNSKVEVKKKEKLVESPYSMFGDNTAVLQTKQEEDKDHSLIIPIIKNNNQEGLFRLDFQTGMAIIKDIEGNILLEEKLMRELFARFVTIDPKAEKYYSISPYVYCANNPIKYTDPNGDTIRVSIYNSATQMMDSYYYGADSNGNYGFIGSNGSIYSGNDTFVGSLSSALSTLRSRSTGKALVDDMISSTNTVKISNSRRNIADVNTNEIGWNDANVNPGAPRPGFIGLGHEMGHIHGVWNNKVESGTWVRVGDKKISNSEKYTTHLENQIRSEHGITLRTHYAYDTSGVGVNSTRLIDATTSTSLFYTQTKSIDITPKLLMGIAPPSVDKLYFTVPFKY